MSINIILADSQGVFRTGAARLLALENDCRIIAQCEDVVRLFKSVDNARSATVVFASSLSVEVARLMERGNPGSNRFVAILENRESSYRYKKNGVQGIVHRDIAASDLVTCIRRVARGGSYFQPRSDEAKEGVDKDAAADVARNRLTAKEQRIIHLIARGYKNKDIADELKNTEQVIKNYLRSIFDKTGVSDRLGLALFAINHPLLCSEDGGEIPVFLNPDRFPRISM